jgi:hypothetical protein
MDRKQPYFAADLLLLVDRRRVGLGRSLNGVKVRLGKGCEDEGSNKGSATVRLGLPEDSRSSAALLMRDDLRTGLLG